jgi:hypothetical protein
MFVMMELLYGALGREEEGKEKIGRGSSILKYITSVQVRV